MIDDYDCRDEDRRWAPSDEENMEHLDWFIGELRKRGFRMPRRQLTTFPPKLLKAKRRVVLEASE